jgi:hypothetical protein
MIEIFISKQNIKMGNLLTSIFGESKEDTIENINDEIMGTDKFITYQDKFQLLSPPRDVFIDENELIIETIQEKLYSIHQYEYDWTDPRSTDDMYKQLDLLYNSYIK